MLIDWLVYGLIIWGLATVLNKNGFQGATSLEGCCVEVDHPCIRLERRRLISSKDNSLPSHL